VLQSVLQALQQLASLECAPSGSRRAALRSLSPELEEEEEQGPRSSGVLRSACALLEDMAAELLPALPRLLQDAFGTHILRSLLLLLAGRSLSDAQRSRRSQKFRARETLAPDALADEGAAARAAQLHMPSSFAALLLRVREAAMAELGSNEARALSVSTTGSPTLQLLLELDGRAVPGGTLDLVLDGLLSAAPDSVDERSAHVEALLRDVVGSHLLQALLPLLPPAALALFWRRHVQGKLGKLGTHPLANFVVAAAARRLPSQLELGDDADSEAFLFEHALGELNASGDKLVKEGKLGVVSALVERAGALGVLYPPAPPPTRGGGGGGGARLESLEERTVRAVRGAFGLMEPEQERLLVPVLLSMKGRKAWDKERRRQAERRRKRQQADTEADASANAASTTPQAPPPAEHDARGAWAEDEELQEWEATMQGSVLLQTMTRLSAPANDAVYQR
jgi:nucleolar protein 9